MKSEQFPVAVAGVLGGLNRSSQHSAEGGCDGREGGARIVPGRGRTFVAGTTTGGEARASAGSGRRSRRDVRAKTPPLMPGYRRRWEPGGSGRLAACHHRILRRRRSRRRGDTCPSPSERRSRCCAFRATACARSRDVSGRAASTLSRELRRNAATRSGGFEYRATAAQWHADRAARRPKPAKLAVNARLRDYVQDRLAGAIAAPGGADIDGPSVAWNGRRPGRRQDRRWAKAWSPEQIASRLRLDFPEDETMRVSHEAIYQSLYVQGRGALSRELTACLRTGRALRLPRSRLSGRGKSFVTPEVMISERPAEAADRAVPGHWEGDLILGLGSSAIGTLVERTTRFTMLLHLPPHARPRRRPACEERPRPRRSRRRGRPRRHRPRDHDAAGAAAPVADLGSGSGDGEARTICASTPVSGLLLRSSQPMAARYEREHERAAAPVLPEGHRPQPPRRRRTRGCRRRLVFFVICFSRFRGYFNPWSGIWGQGHTPPRHARRYAPAQPRRAGRARTPGPMRWGATRRRRSLAPLHEVRRQVGRGFDPVVPVDAGDADPLLRRAESDPDFLASRQLRVEVRAPWFEA